MGLRIGGANCKAQPHEALRSVLLLITLSNFRKPILARVAFTGSPDPFALLAEI